MRVLNLLRWALLTVLIAVLALPAILVSLGELTVVEVDGLSMSPTFGIGDVVTIRPPEPADFREGSVVTVKEGDSERYTHRIVSVQNNGDLILRGDANDFDDPEPVDPKWVVGVVDAHFSGIMATLIMQLQSWPLRICVLAMILGLIFLPMATGAAAPSSRRAKTAKPEREAEAVAESARVESHAGAHQETLDLVDSMRSAVARVLLASDRRLSGTYSVTTKPGSGDFPEVRVVIDIAEKVPAEAPTAQISPSVRGPVAGETFKPVTRREARAATESRRVAPPVAVTDPDHGASVEPVGERRRAHRAQPQRGRRAQRNRRG